MHTRPRISTETMELPLARVSDWEVRSVIRFLRARCETAAEMHRQISAVYGEKCMSKSVVGRWVRKCEGGRTEVHNLWSTSKIWTLSTVVLVYKSYINDIRNVQICKGISWKNREFHRKSACILFNFFGPVVGEKKKSVNLLFENTSYYLFCQGPWFTNLHFSQNGENLWFCEWWNCLLKDF